ncbi:hypothetical protein CSOJ01_15845 [Colletotrichum sojae]|uniref:Uncharacterized protein n=1 Tax=Colletotrichum sojae TaxID=2175907 RepID=A0A8H6IM90_9PEZI|nr:hypothetical protein CSOJ01_15845 [Colletotrichum sojae]
MAGIRAGGSAMESVKGAQPAGQLVEVNERSAAKEKRCPAQLRLSKPLYPSLFAHIIPSNVDAPLLMNYEDTSSQIFSTQPIVDICKSSTTSPRAF